MPPSPLAKKLLLKPVHKATILNAPPGYLDQLNPLPEGADLATGTDGTFDFVQLFVKNVAELERLAPGAMHASKRDGLLWICYPKGTSRVETDLSRDVGWDVVRKAGLEGVAMVSIDDTWSAMRFRRSELVERKKRE